MNDEERRALAELRFDWSPTMENVWAEPEAHVDDMNRDVATAILSAFDQAMWSRGPSPLGIVAEGQHGAGKTHLLSWVRERVQQRGGYFFLLGLPRGREFWQTVVQAYLDGLTRPMTAAPFADQLTMLLEGIADRASVLADTRERVCGRAMLTRAVLDDFIGSVKTKERHLGRECQHTLRALVLLNADSSSLRDVGDEFLTSRTDGAVAEEWLNWGLPTVPKSPQETVSEISRLLALTGPSLLAVDQIDTAFAHARRAVIAHTESTDREPSETVELAEEFGHGLMLARETLYRTVTVVACLPTTWQLICSHALESIPDRFRQESRLSRIPSAQIGVALVAARFALRFAAIGFVPPHPTWPVASVAFKDAPDYTPRALFQRVDAHIRECLRRGVVFPLKDFEQQTGGPPFAAPAEPLIRAEQRAVFDARLSSLRSAADVNKALSPEHEDTEMPKLLTAGLHAWVRERGHHRERYRVMRDAGVRSVHATLRETVDEEIEDYNFWFIRGLAREHRSAVLPRIEWVKQFASLDAALHQRKAVLLRNIDWPKGPRTDVRIREFERVGGSRKKVSIDDLRTFSALVTMLADDAPLLDEWLVVAQPASSTQLFTEIFGDPPDQGAVLAGPDRNPVPRSNATTEGGPFGNSPVADGDRNASSAVGRGDEETPKMALGSVVGTDIPVMIELQTLRKHTAIFAGSGSGKTVLIRRLIEECALQGVSTIVLDPNNDLARLGDPWPQPPATWGVGDADRAKDYMHGTDVLVWTPRRESGRPLSLQPLPNFTAVLGDPDEFELALDTAVSMLAPRALMGGGTARNDRGRAVLREALSYYARRRSGARLTGFVDFLADLPEDVTSLGKAVDLAYDMAQTLTAAMINDPLFGGSGVPLDPGVLFTPAAGKRARVSVISFVGLPTNEQRQSFVNQLQMALFAWIKQNPAGDRPLGGLFVMDEAQTLAPSGAMTACTESTLALASQARKYGLGLVFATQAPRGIHNRIVGNSSTQFYGFLNSPVQITAAKEMAQAKASGVLDISRLTAGQFYAVGEGMPFQKLATPMCLSHHPSSALTTEEVLERARA